MEDLKRRYKMLYNMLVDSLTERKFIKSKLIKMYLDDQIVMIKEEMRKIELLIGE